VDLPAGSLLFEGRIDTTFQNGHVLAYHDEELKLELTLTNGVGLRRTVYSHAFKTSFAADQRSHSSFLLLTLRLYSQKVKNSENSQNRLIEGYSLAGQHP